MLDGLFRKEPRKHIDELNLVPIIDMFTTIIFFLLLSTTFIALTQLTTPPSQVSTSDAQADVPPPTPKLFLVRQDGRLELTLGWAGAQPGQSSERVAASGDRDEIVRKADKLVTEFSARYPAEKTLQIGLGRDVPYQSLISVMDGVRERMPDVVLVSYSEAEARPAGGQP